MLALAVVGAALLAWLAEQLARMIPFAAERTLAQRYETALPQRGEAERYLQRLVDALAPHAGLTPEMTLTVHLVDDDTVNAMATLGGHLIVFRGLLERLESENALAFVLAHEIAHIKHRDPIVALGRGAIVQLALAVVLGNGGGAVGDLLGSAGLLTLLRFSREQELAADRAALAVVARHYGHIGASLDTFRLFAAEQAEHGGYAPQPLRSHPYNATRTAALTRLARDRGWPVAGHVTPLPDALLQAPQRSEAP